MISTATIASMAVRDGFFDGDWVESVDQDPDGSIRLLQLADVGDGQFRDRSDRRINTEAFDRLGCSWVRSRDVLIARMPEPIGRACLVPEGVGNAVTVVDVAVVRPDLTRVDARYLTYSINSAGVRSLIASFQDGATRQRIPRKRLGRIPIPFASLDDQQRIADYLDRETAQVDQLLAKQRALIEISRERRSALRDQHLGGSHATRRSTTVRRVLAPLNRPAVQGLGVVTAYRDGVVTLRSLRRDDGYTFSDLEQGYQEVVPGDLVFHALDGFAGAVGISDSHGVCTPVYHVCQVIADDVPEYVAMLLRYLGTSGFLAAQAPNVRERSVDFRNWQNFARIPLDLPSADEQRAVVADILERTTEIDTLIAKAERFVELAEERRAALITAVVTGQVDVGAAA